ncbi:hypothetical protein [Actinomadura opuntiae]|uniref:hypothetical protein n=1 Tax=Actinomadura sp. OS1-43 TaxID=604315 RepID=UPI00255B37AB|nr:hypothetical protein [Actinomadura sp. OS1-43]MDL4814963.1 hypothetical protein [Actinomadura sp. OS1-43]
MSEQTIAEQLELAQLLGQMERIAEQIGDINLTLRDVVKVMRMQTELLTSDPLPAAATEAPSVPAPRGRRRHLHAVPDLAPEAERFAR